MESQARNRLRTMLGELLDYMEGAQEVASGIAHEYPEYEAMADEVRKATDMVAMACEVEAYGSRELRLTRRRRPAIAYARGSEPLATLLKGHRFFPPQPFP